MSLVKKIENCSSKYSEVKKTFVDPKGKSASNYKVENQQRKDYKIIQFDDCVFNSDDTKCDYGMETDNDIKFIELKGSDNNYGLKQLYETLVLTKDFYSQKNKFVRLIVSKSDAPRNLDYNTIEKIAKIVGERINGKNKKFIKTNNTFTEVI